MKPTEQSSNINQLANYTPLLVDAFVDYESSLDPESNNYDEARRPAFNILLRKVAENLLDQKSSNPDQFNDILGVFFSHLIQGVDFELNEYPFLFSSKLIAQLTSKMLDLSLEREKISSRGRIASALGASE